MLCQCKIVYHVSKAHFNLESWERGENVNSSAKWQTKWYVIKIFFIYFDSNNQYEMKIIYNIIYKYII